MVESSDNEQTIVDPKDAAQSVGLRYVSDATGATTKAKAYLDLCRGAAA